MTAAADTPTHALSARSRSGQRLNPLTWGSPTFRTAYGEADVGARLARAARDPDIEVSVRPLRSGPVARCPADGAPLGGPVMYLCPACGHGVMAADAHTGDVS